MMQIDRKYSTKNNGNSPNTGMFIFELVVRVVDFVHHVFNLLSYAKYEMSWPLTMKY